MPTPVSPSVTRPGSASAFSTLRGRNLLTLDDVTGAEILELVERAELLRQRRRDGANVATLAGKAIALIFLKPSTRTRAAFIVAATQTGAHAEVFTREDIRFGVKESTKDIARVLGRMFDGIMFRGFEHATIAEFAAHAGVPVWNGLCEQYHPTQVLADLLTLRQNFGELSGLPLTYVGDGRNNMAVTLAIAAARIGLDLRILAPRQLHPDPDLIAGLLARRESTAGGITVTDDWSTALDGSAALYSDVWVSMGEEDQTDERIALLRDYKVTAAMMAATRRPDSIYLHCLPAFHDLDTEAARARPDLREVDDDVFEGPNSRVFDQAENRMHTAKAVMELTLLG